MLHVPISLGPPTANLAFYLPNPPTFPDNWHWHHPDSIKQLIELNGNHWRKILTIMAKISSDNVDWRQYRTHQLLKANEQLHCNTKQLAPQATWHLVCGQQAAEQLNINHNLATLLDGSNKVRRSIAPPYHQHLILLTPYLDYRQFPNRDIDTTHTYITETTLRN